MACFVATVSLTYRLKGQTGAGTTVSRTSACLAAPFSTELDRSADGFFLIYNGGRQLLESGWTNYDLLSSSITAQTPCTGCTLPPEEISYDCINGACVPETTYGTLGLYPSLSACETACGTGCSGKCISNSEWAQIEGLSNQIKNINCS